MLLFVPFVWGADGDYRIPEAIEHVTINDDGSCLISEDILYDIEGSVNGVYRDIPVGSKQSVTNVSVVTPGYYNKVEVIKQSKTSNNIRIKVWLYKDKDKTEKVHSEKVKVNYKYTFNRGVKVYNDIAEFQYMSWGKGWSSGVDSLKTYVTVPGSGSECEYWNNPDTYITGSKWNGNVLESEARNIPEKDSLEQRIIMPKSFIKSTENANVINKSARDKIESDQKKYGEDSFYKYWIPRVVISFMGIIMIIPVGIYVKFGREPKIDYDKEYEYDLPTDSTPVEVNSIVIGTVGKVNVYAFNSVLLDLIYRGFLKIISSGNNTILKLTGEAWDSLKDYEVDLLEYLKKFEDSDGGICMSSIKDKEYAGDYVAFLNAWLLKAEKSVSPGVLNHYFDNRGAKILKVFSLVLALISIVVFFSIFTTGTMIIGNKEIFSLWFALPIIGFFEAIFLYVVDNKIPGRWTREGKEFHDKWLNFEKYIRDYSLINERPPESVQVWGKYLVYAAALGIAGAAISTMRDYFNVKDVSGDFVDSDDVLCFAYYGGFNQWDSSFSELHNEFTASLRSDDFGDIGSVGGGGFGGGGGGTF